MTYWKKESINIFHKDDQTGQRGKIHIITTSFDLGR